jgi:hypothetical protein
VVLLLQGGVEHKVLVATAVQVVITETVEVTATLVLLASMAVVVEVVFLVVHLK